MSLMLPASELEGEQLAVNSPIAGTSNELVSQKESQIVEGHLMSDNVYMCISISPKYSVLSVVGYIKGKSAISIAKCFMGKRVIPPID